MELNKLHIGLNYETYAAEPGFRSSWLHKLKVSPQHFQATLNQPDEDTPAKKLGRLVHSIFENGEQFIDLMKVQPTFTGLTKDGRPSTQSAEAKQAKKEWFSSLPKDTIVVTQDELEILIGIANQVKNSRLLTNMLKGSVRESSLWVKDPATDLLLKIRPDFVMQSGWIADLKTTRLYAKDFPREIFSDKYNSRFYILNAAFYVHCAKLAGLSKSDNITMISLETFPPYGFKCFNLDMGCLSIGFQWVDHLLKQYAECLASNKWPGYTEEVTGLAPPEFPPLPRDLEEASL